MVCMHDRLHGAAQRRVQGLGRRACFHQTARAAVITSSLLLASVTIAARVVAKVRQAQQVMISCSLSATIVGFAMPELKLWNP